MTRSGSERLWDETVDVVVVGAGFAGLRAAIEAAASGVGVLVLEKMKAAGGNSIISDGSVAAAGSALQAKHGIEDSAELMMRDMLAAGQGLNNLDLVRALAEESASAVQWAVERLGIEFQDRVLQFGGHSVPRTLATPNLSGASIFRPMLAHALELGVELRTRWFLDNLVMDANGSVCGVVVRDGYRHPSPASGRPHTVRSLGAVVLASGGFGSDIEFRSAQDPRLSAAVGSTNAKGATAEALRAAMMVGAQTLHLSHIQLGPWASPDESGNGTGPVFATYVSFPYGILVDPTTGDRFVNEMADRKTRADAILRIGHPCVSIADSAGLARSGQKIDACIRRGVVAVFQTVEELARAYGIPHAELTRTLDRFNRSCANRWDDNLGKPILEDAEPIQHPPFFAMRHWPKVHYTMGGLRIDAAARVIGGDEKPIEGLLAAGEVTGGVHGACRLGSVSITECLVFGRRAGLRAARRARE